MDLQDSRPNTPEDEEEGTGINKAEHDKYYQAKLMSRYGGGPLYKLPEGS